MKKILLTLFIGAVLFTGCKKDDDNDCAETVAAIAGSYKISKVTLSGSDVTAGLDNCQKSGVLALNANGTLTYTETASCSGDGTGTWSMTGNNIMISHSGAGSDYEGTVSNNCSNIVITEDFGGGLVYVVTLARQ